MSNRNNKIITNKQIVEGVCRQVAEDISKVIFRGVEKYFVIEFNFEAGAERQRSKPKPEIQGVCIAAGRTLGNLIEIIEGLVLRLVDNLRLVDDRWLGIIDKARRLFLKNRDGQLFDFLDRRRPLSLLRL